MKNVVFICFLFFINSSNCILGQTLDFNTDKIKTYYKFTYLAEKSIYESRFDSAVYYYKIANSHHKLFKIDCYNSLMSAVKSNDITSSIKFIEILLEKGISLEYFLKNDIFYGITNSKEWMIFLKKEIKPTYNQDLSNYILALFDLDQKFRKDDIIHHDTLIKIDIYISDQLDSLFAQYGYLSEDLVGTFQEQKDVFPIGWSPLDVILIHQVKFFKNKYKIFFESAVLNGKMRNSVLLSHATNFGQDSQYLFRCFYYGIGDILKIGNKCFTCGKNLEDKVNFNRRRIFYPPLNHSIRGTALKKELSQFYLASNPLNYTELKSKEGKNRLIAELVNQGYEEVVIDQIK